MGNEDLMKTHEKNDADDYFQKFPRLDCDAMRAIFYSAYKAGWNARGLGRDVNGNLTPSEPFVQSD